MTARLGEWTAASIHGAGGALGRGNGHIAGVAPGLLTVDGAPARRPILLFFRQGLGLQPIAQSFSRADGTYQFAYLDESAAFTLVALDSERIHNAVVADLIVPVAMPE